MLNGDIPKSLHSYSSKEKGVSPIIMAVVDLFLCPIYTMSMKALCKEKSELGASLITAPEPKPKRKEVLVKVKASAICGTDKHIYRWDDWAKSRINPPLIFGHEFSGEIVELGKDVEHMKVGDHVSAETHVPCEGCFQCRTGNMHLCHNVKIIGLDRAGCFAEYISIPEICCIKNDVSLPWKIGAIQEPLGNAVHCLSEANVAGKSVAIFGDGPLGVFAVAVARAFGAMKVIAVGMQKYRLAMMKKYDPDLIVDVNETVSREKIMEYTKNEGVDVAIEMSGSESALHDAFNVVKMAGTVVMFGIPPKPVTIDVANEIVFKGIKILAINGRKMFKTWFEIASLLESKRVDLSSVITHEFPLNEFEKAFGLLLAPEVKAGKIILYPESVS